MHASAIGAAPRPRRARLARRARWTLAVAALVVLAAACAPAPPPGVAIRDVRVIADDDPRWARPDADDRAWPLRPITAVDPAVAVWWIRGLVRLDAATLADGRSLGVAVLALASCEAYWDGARLGSNGTVSDRPDGERPGRLGWLMALPAGVGPGDHLLSLRCSAHHRGFDPSTGFYGIWVADHATLATVQLAYAAPTLISAGALCTVGLFYVMTFAVHARRRRAHLWLGVFALAAGALVLAESARALVNYTYDLHLDRLIVITALAWLVNVSLLAFLTRRFALAGRGPVLAVGVVLASAEGLDETIKLPGLTQAFLERTFGAAELAALRDVLRRLEATPAMVDVPDPRTGARVRLAISRFDLQLAIGAMIANPTSQRMLAMLIPALASGDFSAVAPSLLAAGQASQGLHGMPEAMDAASGVSAARRARIAAEAPGTVLEDVLNFPGDALAGALGITDLGDDFRAPLRSDVPTLLLSGDRDGRTYVESHRQLAAGLRGAVHVVVEGAGHDLFMDAPEVTARIVAFLAGEQISAAPIRSTANPPSP